MASQFNRHYYIKLPTNEPISAQWYLPVLQWWPEVSASGQCAVRKPCASTTRWPICQCYSAMIAERRSAVCR
eukprot:5105844-Pleurochrysis_carterae.AAC.1